MGSATPSISQKPTKRKTFNVGTHTIHLLVILLIYLTSTANGFCPSKCICAGDANNLHTNCIDAGLEVVPIQLNPNMKHINLTYNKISNVHYTLTFYNQLETLDVSNNVLESLGSRNFVSQDQLRQLYLQRNTLKNLSKDTFKGLKQLEILNLSDNQINFIHPQALTDLMQLQYLDLTNNSLISVENNLFSRLINLEILLFTNNQLLSVPYSDNFEYLKKLKYLDLAGNLIERIHNHSFYHMNELKTLKLNGNVINKIDLLAFDGLVQLNYMDLSDNNLTNVPTEQLSKLSNLTYLSLSGNFIDALPAVSFLNLFKLKVLHLDRLVNLERIDTRAFIDNMNLQILTLDDNEQFSELPVHLFHGNPHLIELSLRNNKLYKLDAVQLPLDQLKKLALSDNPLVCNCSLIWLWQLIKSSSVTASDNNGMGKAEQMVSRDTDRSDAKDDPINDNLSNSSNVSNVLIIDKNSIGCDIIITNDNNNVKVIRKLLMDMSENDIQCPTHIVTIISVIMTVIFIAVICVSILIIIKCSRTAQLKRRQQKYLSSERQNIGELIIPQKIDKYELERYLAEQQLQHQQKQQQIQQQYQMNSHTIQPKHLPNQNQYFQQQNSLNKANINDYRSLKQWDNNHLHQFPLNNHQTLIASSTPTMTSSSPLKKLQKNNIHVVNSSFSNSNPDDEDRLSQQQIYNNHPDDDEDNSEDHYENPFEDNYLNSLNHKINIQSTLPLTTPTVATTIFNTNPSKKQKLSKQQQNGVGGKPHIVYV